MAFLLGIGKIFAAKLFLAHNSRFLEHNVPGGLPYKSDGGARRTFLKQDRKGARISVSGRSPN